MKKIISWSFVLVFLFSCKKTSVNEADQTTATLVPTEEIDAFIKEQISKHGQFEWSSAPDDMVWSALQHSDDIMSIGYQPQDATGVKENLHNISINSSDWKDAREKVLKMILE